MSNAAPRLAVVLALALAGVLPGRAAAQPPSRVPAPQPAGSAPGGASAAAPTMRDLPLTAAERRAYVGTYSAALPQGGTGLVQIYA